jgi:uncharacterized protein YkwD
MNRRLLLIVSLASMTASWPASAQEAGFVRDIFDRINAQRVQHGLKPCTYNNKLEKASQFHAEWMAGNRKMEHLQEEAKSLEDHKTCTHHPINRAIRAGYREWDDIFFIENRPNGPVVHTKPDANNHVGEIIAAGWNAGHPATQTSSVVNGWMKSPGHRKEILTAHYEEMGIGVACTADDRYDTFLCVVLGDPRK